MPLKKDPEGGGTGLDGRESVVYCSRCYAAGAFAAPQMTVGQMQDLVKGKLKDMGLPGFVAGFFTRGIPRLERWKR